MAAGELRFSTVTCWPAKLASTASSPTADERVASGGVSAAAISSMRAATSEPSSPSEASASTETA